jgi:hypothetical protein
MLVHHAILQWEAHEDKARDFDDTVFEGYLEGLRDAGWEGDPRQARFGQIVRHFGAHAPPLRTILDESQHARIEQSRAATMAELLDRFAEGARHPLIDWDEDARELLNEL